ncbi:IclR family transcriptional regulator [Agrobacterium pusense]|uniref:IclR family transcriptional regulator n=1 Tax=Agrobacterium pusense TaxID=648995 RepID=UPI003FD61AEC
MLVKQVENVLDILEFFAEEGKPASLADLSEHFGWPRSSTFNVLTTLVSRGYLFELGGRGKYYPTPRWMAVAQKIGSAEPVPEPLLGLAQHLGDTTGETVCIGVASGGSLVYLEVVLARERVRYAAEVGQRIPLHATAGGMAVMSQWSSRQRAALLAKVDYQRYGQGTPMSAEAVETEIQASLKRGWFKSASNFSVDLGGVSLPLILHERVFAITVAGPQSRIQERMPAIAAAMHEAVADHLGPRYFEENVTGLTTPPRLAA